MLLNLANYHECQQFQSLGLKRLFIMKFFHPTKASRHIRSGFTLIELLVVIAIIAILASILFPVFGRARENARRSSCQSNLKQIGLGMMQYTQDYDEKLPGYRMSYRNPFAGRANAGTQLDSNTFFNQIVQPYVKSDQLWICPSNPNGWVNIDEKGANTAVGDPFQSYGGQNSYALSNYVFPGRAGISLTSFAETARTVGVVDGRYYNTLPKGPTGAPCKLKGQDYSATTGIADPTSSSYPYYWKQMGNSYISNFSASATSPTTAEAEEKIKSRHMETINVLWMDGHVKTINWNTLVNDPDLKVGGTQSIWDPYKQGCQ
jgi:prepilin-type N-terminal cleavage/methylation domain-containing protein/prepilin-type processing-associated H-X9-DG protein